MQVHLTKDPNHLSYEAAEWMTTLIEATLHQQDRFCLLLSGGSTPKHLYKLLAENSFKKRIDWIRLHIFFGDERTVPFSDERNNGKMAYDALLSKVPIPKTQVHYIKTSVKPQLAAEDYSRLLRQYFNNTSHTFDLALLGMGDDGHTLSIFPGCESLNQIENWVVEVDTPSNPLYRVSLVPHVVNRSACIAFLVTGPAKAPILNKILHNTAAPHSYPAQLIQPSNGELHWFIDEAAVDGQMNSKITNRSG
jgi:6-phosphogluconolactonase